MTDFDWAKIYEKRPVRVQAMQWKGNNIGSIRAWGAPVSEDEQTGRLSLYVAANKQWLDISLRDWIIQDRLGYYPCSYLVFDDTYREVTDAELHTAADR